MRNSTWSASSILRQRSIVRQRIAQDIKQTFQPEVTLTVHWDGKMLAGLISKKKEDRLAIAVSGEGISKLLAVPAIPSGTGKAQADAVFEAIEDWKITDRVTFMCFGTTSSNTGREIGACIKLEEKFGKKLFHFACRHHIHELLPAAAFDSLFGPSSGPNIKLFQTFSEAWDTLDYVDYHSAMQDTKISGLLEPVRDDSIDFIKKQLLVFQPRDDYKELLQLVLLFLGGNTVKNVTIRVPGAYHRARCMGKIIYCMKIYIFRNQFRMKAKDLDSLRQFNVFIVRVYFKKWYIWQSPVLAPLNDLQMLKDLVQYNEINRKLAEVTLKKFSGHQWYLSEMLAGLALFDSRLTLQEKKKW